MLAMDRDVCGAMWETHGSLWGKNWAQAGQSHVRADIVHIIEANSICTLPAITTSSKLATGGCFRFQTTALWQAGK